MNSYNFSPFPLMETENYILRKLTSDDDQEIYITRSDGLILKYLDIRKAKSLEDARHFIEKINRTIENNESIYWVICYKNSPQLIGTICLWNISAELNKADIGFILLPQFQGKRVLQEVIPKVIEYGFETMKLEKIEGEVVPENIKSIKLMEKFGFKYDYKLDNTVVYSLSKQRHGLP